MFCKPGIFPNRPMKPHPRSRSGAGGLGIFRAIFGSGSKDETKAAGSRGWGASFLPLGYSKTAALSEPRRHISSKRVPHYYPDCLHPLPGGCADPRPPPTHTRWGSCRSKGKSRPRWCVSRKGGVATVQRRCSETREPVCREPVEAGRTP